MEQKIVDWINILLQCNPNQCRYSDCPLYFAEVGKCDAKRVINVIKLRFDDKFSVIKTYDPLEQE